MEVFPRNRNPPIHPLWIDVIGWVPTRYSKSLLWRILKYLFAIILHVFQNNSKSFRPGIIEDQIYVLVLWKFHLVGGYNWGLCSLKPHQSKNWFSNVAKIINAKITCEIWKNMMKTSFCHFHSYLRRKMLN